MSAREKNKKTESGKPVVVEMRGEEARALFVGVLQAYFGEAFVPLPDSITYADSFDYLTVEQVRQAVVALVMCLNLGGGTGLYEPITALLTDREMRAKIDALLVGWDLYGCRAREKLIPS